jgi:hypothetical protein
MTLIVDKTLFSNFYAFAADFRCVGLPLEIKSSILRFGKHTVSIFRVDESEGYPRALI